MPEGIEDFENWHGKAIPKDKEESLLSDLRAQIQSKNPNTAAKPPADDADPVDISVKLSSPSDYKKGDKVNGWGTQLKLPGPYNSR